MRAAAGEPGFFYTQQRRVPHKGVKPFSAAIVRAAKGVALRQVILIPSIASRKRHPQVQFFIASRTAVAIIKCGVS
jgi:hypothetical protein